MILTCLLSSHTCVICSILGYMIFTCLFFFLYLGDMFYTLVWVLESRHSNHYTYDDTKHYETDITQIFLESKIEIILWEWELLQLLRFSTYVKISFIFLRSCRIPRHRDLTLDVTYVTLFCHTLWHHLVVYATTFQVSFIAPPFTCFVTVLGENTCSIIFIEMYTWFTWICHLLSQTIICSTYEFVIHSNVLYIHLLHI